MKNNQSDSLKHFCIRNTLDLISRINVHPRRACAKSTVIVPDAIVAESCQLLGQIGQGNITSVISSLCRGVQDYNQWLHDKCHPSKEIKRGRRIANQCLRFRSV